MKWKKLLAGILTAAMLVTMMPVVALAAEPEYGWYDAAASEYSISTAAELVGLAHIANGTATTATGTIPQSNFVGKKVTLAADINLDGMTWTPISSFAGELDGGNHKIYNFKMGYTTDSEGYQYCGFFHEIQWDKGLVCNLTIQDVTAEIGTKGRFGTVAYIAGGGNDKDYTDHQIYNVHVKNVTVTSTSADARVGGMFCKASRSFKDCTVENLTVQAPNGIYTLGGFVSFVYANNQRFQNCDVKGITVRASNCNNEDGIGGFAGYMNNTYGWSNYFEGCDVRGIDFTVSGTKAWVGGFIGSPCANLLGSDCSAAGKIDASGVTDGFVGGFMGNYGWRAAVGGFALLHDLKNCAADVDIVSGGASAGGFIGSASTSNDGSKYGKFKNCTASGDVMNMNGAAGGFAGEAKSGQFENCTASGNVNGKVAGGFIGKVEDYTPNWDSNVKYDRIGNANEIKLDGCTTSGTVIGSDTAAGFVGKVGEKTSADTDGSNGKLVIKNSTAAGTIVGTKTTTTVNNIMGDGTKVDTDNSTANDDTKKIRIEAKDDDLSVDANGKVTVPEGKTVIVDNKEITAVSGNLTIENGKLIVPRGGQIKVDGTEVDLPYGGVIGANAEVTANKKPARKYDISIDAGKHGTVKADTTRAKKDAMVTLTITPDDGYELDEIIVQDADGGEVDVKEKKGKYTFTMPPADVTVEVSFAKIKEKEPEPEEVEEIPVQPEEQRIIRLTIGQRAAWVIDGYVVNDVAPEIRNGRTMLPIRFIVEALGGTVAWNAETKTVTIVKDGKEIEIFLGQDFALDNGEIVALDAPALIVNDRTYLPLRFVAEKLGAEVTWDAETQTITIIG